MKAERIPFIVIFSFTAVGTKAAMRDVLPTPTRANRSARICVSTSIGANKMLFIGNH